MTADMKSAIARGWTNPAPGYWAWGVWRVQKQTWGWRWWHVVRIDNRSPAGVCRTFAAAVQTVEVNAELVAK